MGRWSNGRWVWDFQWRRDLLDRELEVVHSLTTFISGVSPKSDCEDRWEWRGHKSGTYTTNSAYRIIKGLKEDKAELPPAVMAARKIWKSPAPHKARMTAWRALFNRLPTCNNLVKRQIDVGVVERFCNGCFAQDETANHIFLRCPKIDMIWNHLYTWLGFQSVRPFAIPDHFLSFSQLGSSKFCGRFLSVLWSCFVWVVWR
ncbi:uncharacterized protein LOC131024787 [Salvia miltiorrhiza]|uniref:uncharacterized protein LOC131024787 n=1 Tax=Salvia miltiorrhiza TaxID=226208 RepID=UPI0025AD7E8A|nr:uncharacterized protein LOC131024787 [Salvia miltiorrhiza]